MKPGHLLLAVLLLLNIASAIGVVYARHEHRQLFVQLSAREKARDELNIDFGRLQLEQRVSAGSGNYIVVLPEPLAPGAYTVVLTDASGAAQRWPLVVN